MLGQSIAKNPGYLKLRKLKASSQISSTIAASQNRVYLNSNSLLLNVADPSFDENIVGVAQPKK